MSSTVFFPYKKKSVNVQHYELGNGVVGKKIYLVLVKPSWFEIVKPCQKGLVCVFENKKQEISAHIYCYILDKNFT